ncbi:MAG TPA: four helix bundle protein, partial [Phycisphaerales bacterium]|nr:four helix bundle protein [Phycisphaerales bacterium]
HSGTAAQRHSGTAAQRHSGTAAQRSLHGGRNMARLGADLLDRTKMFSHRMLDVAEVVAENKSNPWMTNRIVHQIVGCGTSVGANTREADEAMTRKDFCHCLSIVLKELSESRFWLELVTERGWIPSSRLSELVHESRELSSIFSVMVARSRAKPTRPKR